MKGVYMINNKVNNNKYIGESLDLVKRYLTHIDKLKAGTHDNYKLQNDFNKYGLENLEFTVLLIIDDKIDNTTSKALQLIFEDKYIIKYNTINNGYNIQNTMDDLYKDELELPWNKMKDIITLTYDELKNKKFKKIDKIIYEVNPQPSIIKYNKSKAINQSIECYFNKYNISYESNKHIIINKKNITLDYYFEYNNKNYVVLIDTVTSKDNFKLPKRSDSILRWCRRNNIICISFTKSITDYPNVNDTLDESLFGF